MSNLIKYPFVDLRGKETRVIKYKEDDDKFVPMDHKKKVLVKSLDEVKQEEERAKLEKMESEAEEKKENNFSAGVPVTNFDEMLAKKKEEAQEVADEILQRARTDAEAMLEEARNQVQEICNAAKEEGIELGREEGFGQAAAEIEKIRTELVEQRNAQEKEYQQLMQSVEGNYVNILCELLRKLTGVIVEDRQDVILHLIRSGLEDAEPAKKFIIRIGSKDLLFVEGNKEEIKNKAGIDGILEVQEEKSLGEGECIIETDSQMIDCGFRTQLENLVSTLRMLA